MNKEKIILFGASKLGEIAYIMLKDKYDVLYYCDNDQSKVGDKINNIEIISTKKLKELNDDVKILIASNYYREISKQLEKMNKTNFEKFSICINAHEEDSESLNIKQLNLGKFIKSIEKGIKINSLTYITGGSLLLDYIFLRALALKFNISTYLEIGSFMGESISSIADVINKGYSISLPDSELENYFSKMDMNNFSSYFMNKKDNIIQYKGDSKLFDYSKIKDKIDLVFIDGDHSYEGVYEDTKKIFDFIDKDETIVVWHDFKRYGKYRKEVIDAVFDALPKDIHNNIYAVDNNICGIYIPDKYLEEFNFEKEKDTIFSYETTINVKENKL